MELMVLACWGELPESPAELVERFLEAEWMEQTRARFQARELAELLAALLGGR